jgi:hypothetical protein
MLPATTRSVWEPAAINWPFCWVRSRHEGAQRPEPAAGPLGSRHLDSSSRTPVWTKSEVAGSRFTDPSAYSQVKVSELWSAWASPGVSQDGESLPTVASTTSRIDSLFMASCKPQGADGQLFTSSITELTTNDGAGSRGRYGTSALPRSAMSTGRKDGKASDTDPDRSRDLLTIYARTAGISCHLRATLCHRHNRIQSEPTGLDRVPPALRNRSSKPNLGL